MSPESISGHLLLLSLFFLVASPSFSQSDPRQILLKLKTEFAGSSTRVFISWNENNPVCNFTGVICDSNNSIKEINLSKQGLDGTLDFGLICSLESIEKISLRSNRLHGNISSHLSDCINLQLLDLGANLFSGMFPDISSLTHLQFLNLDINGFSGPFPWKSLETLTNLTYLSLGDNLYNRTPFPSEILKLEKLQFLSLTNSSIEGRIPEEIGNLVLLQTLELSYNYLVGPIPKGITKLTKLQELQLYDNELSWSFPVGFRNLVMLSQLDVSNNSLEGDLSELKNLTRIEILHLYENKFSGKIPVEFGEFKFLQRFSAYDNMFTGELPGNIGSWAGFINIDVSENFLTGSIPPDMCKNGNLRNVLMLENKFTGGLPETYANCSSLNRLRVSNNSLSGRVPDGIWGLPNIRMIDLSMNQFEGPVASNIGEAKSLAQLFIAYNRFSGNLPQGLSKASNLVKMELMHNLFYGEIPERIGDLKQLNTLYLDSNFLAGTIPESLGSCVSLNDLNLAGNSLSGQIPESLGSLRVLNSLNLSDNKLSGAIPASLSSPRLSLIDLSNNMLRGRVPESLLAEEYDGSFAGNPGLCGDGSRGLRKCPLVSGRSGRLGIAKFCFIVSALVLVLSLACYVILKSKQKDCNSLTNQGFRWEMKQFHVMDISEGEILRSIKQENLIGKGGSGNVYKVEVACGKQLAVKHMWKSGIGSGDQKSSPILPKRKNRWMEYDAEVATLSLIRHVNVVKLYCSITNEVSNLLVYEYMPKGSLWDQLHTYQKIKMNWKVRYEIAMGAAKGLEYLHHGCDGPVIHRDVKSSNILLDEEMKPKIADFGLAKIVHINKVMDSTHVIAGTHGYIAPEYGCTLNVTEKSDIYSFGVVLMELITGKKAIQPEFGENKNIVCWVHDELRSKGKPTALVDPAISDEFKGHAANTLTIAIHCTMRVPSLRPSMRMVVQMLEHSPINIMIENDVKVSRTKFV